MPGGDKTGPMGAGPMTGRGAGYCAGYRMPGYANPVVGRGGGFGWGGGGRGRGGGGRGWGRGFHGGAPYPAWGYAPQRGGPAYDAPVTTGEEISELKAQVKYYEAMLKDLKKKMEDVEQGIEQDSE